MTTKWPLGVFTSVDAGLGISFDVLAELNIPTIQLHAPHAERRSDAAAANLRAQLRELNIEVTCVFAGFEGESYADIPTVEKTVGLVPKTTRETRVSELKNVADFADLIGVGAVGLHLGFVPHDSESTDYQELLCVARDVCDYCADKNMALHLETGQEPAEILESFLEQVDRPNLFVNFDPANMILYGCGHPLDALQRIGRYVRSVHCKDALWSQQPGVTWGTEVPLGEGDVDFNRFLGVLEDIGYDGSLTIEREIPQDSARQLEEIAKGVTLLRNIIEAMSRDH